MMTNQRSDTTCKTILYRKLGKNPFIKSETQEVSLQDEFGICFINFNNNKNIVMNFSTDLFEMG